MANAVVGDVGDVIAIDTGQDLTGNTELNVFITLPHGTMLTKTKALNGVNTGTSDFEGIIYYTIESDVCVAGEDGELLISCNFVVPGGTFSQAEPDTYIVRRRNQVAA